MSALLKMRGLGTLQKLISYHMSGYAETVPVVCRNVEERPRTTNGSIQMYHNKKEPQREIAIRLGERLMSSGDGSFMVSTIA